MKSLDTRIKILLQQLIKFLNAPTIKKLPKLKMRFENILIEEFTTGLVNFLLHK